jgi:hypothetical protein
LLIRFEIIFVLFLQQDAQVGAMHHRARRLVLLLV